jgi:hypothetical protein
MTDKFQVGPGRPVTSPLPCLDETPAFSVRKQHKTRRLWIDCAIVSGALVLLGMILFDLLKTDSRGMGIAFWEYGTGLRCSCRSLRHLSQIAGVHRDDEALLHS